jgi:hypothetical protein
MKNYLLSRLTEPSTFAGLGLMLSMLGLPVSPTALGLFQQIVTGAAGLFAILKPEAGQP